MTSARPRAGGRTARFPRTALALPAALAAALTLLSGCSSPAAPAPEQTKKQQIVEVPADAPTIAQAVERVAPGGLVLVSPGDYRESVTVQTPGITIRGTDRNKVVIDGEGQRPEGIVVVADGVRVENLTVKSHLFNGVLITGQHDGAKAGANGVDGYEHLDTEKYPPIQGFAVDRVTAYNNGLYGIYAFDSQHGSITNTYTSGHPDSGIYVGQCRECDVLVTGNTAANNAVGFENSNASDSVVILGNDWSGNRVGMTLTSNYQETFVPQRGNTIAGNKITNNTSSDSPSQADGGFGIGIGIGGGQENTIERNLVTGNPTSGVSFTNTEDIPAKGNRLEGNTFGKNGVDVANTSEPRTPASGNCVSGKPSTVPAGLAISDCGGGAPQKSAADGELPSLAAPPGVSFLKVTAPPEQPGLSTNLRSVPAPLPKTVQMPEPKDFPVPAADWTPGP